MKHFMIAVFIGVVDVLHASSAQPDDAKARTFFDQGMEAMKKRELERAAGHFSEAIRLDPKHAAAHLQRGIANYIQKHYAKAIPDFTVALTLDPANAEAFYVRGAAYRHLGDYERAHADATSALRIAPTNPRYLLLRGHANHGRKQYELALADWTRASQIDAKNVLAHYWSAWLWATCPDAKYRDGKRAVEAATRVCALTDWKEPSYFALLAAAHAEAGNFELAVQWQKKHIAAMDKSATAEDREKAQRQLVLYQGKKYREP